MNLENHYDSRPDIPIGKKRGRPKKDPSQIPWRDLDGAYHGRRAHFGRANGNHPHQVDAANSAEDAIVGTSVTGIIEAAFDAGYVLSVRVGDSDTHLRGVVFKTGHYHPVMAENDVAPSLQMIRRNEVHFPSTTRTPVHGTSRHGQESNQHHMVYPLNQHPAIDAPHIASQPAHLAASKDNHGLPSPQVETPKSFETNNCSATLSAEGAYQVGISRARISVKHSETLVGEAAKSIDQGTSGSVASESANSAGMTSLKASGFTPGQMRDLSQPLLVQPLQSIQSDALDQSVSTLQPRKGKMTELLLAVQENNAEKHAAHTWQAE